MQYFILLKMELVESCRIKNGRNPDPSYSIIDSQSVKTTSAAEKRGVDGGKKIKGHKRHIMVDTQGHILHIKVHEANKHDTVAGCDVFREAVVKYPSLERVCADAGYRKTMEQFVQNILNKTITISERISNGWIVLAKRWIVERTFAWLNHFRRLSKDYEITVAAAKNTVIISHSMLLLKRLAIP